ncbi:MAG: hypothetical protein ACTHMM_17805 [Agriterribacter sp.]
MKFTSHGRQYEIDRFGVIVQTDHRPYVYDAAYSATYDTEAYRAGSNVLQALRIGFVTAAHGQRVNSILDAGYGNGAFMQFAKTHIPNVYGHDVTGVMVPGCYIMPEFVKADVGTFWDVLEHFPSLDFVKDLPFETICLSLPYCHMITQGKEWFDVVYKHRKPDEHIRHFNEFSLSSLMDSYGWKTIAVSGHEDIVRKSTHGLQNILSMAFKRK